MCHYILMQQQTRQPVQVSLVTTPECTPTALYGLFEVLSSTGSAWPALTGKGEPRELFEVKLVSADGEPFTAVMGTPFFPHASMADMETSDVVIVTDLALAPDADPRTMWKEEHDWIHRQYERGAMVCSVCTGAILLAGTGLLDGKEVTTHWGAVDSLRHFFPALHLREEQIIIPAGDEGRIVTCGGSSSWEDLALHLIGHFYGREEAVRTAKIFLFGDRSEGQLPYAAMRRAATHEDAAIAECQSWVGMHYADPMPVARMVEHSGLTERTFKRRFKRATGFAPLDYVQALRIEEAKQILETTDDPVDMIAPQVGYEDPTSFRRLFKRFTGVTPNRYRQRFRLIAGAA